LAYLVGTILFLGITPPSANLLSKKSKNLLLKAPNLSPKVLFLIVGVSGN